MNDSVVQAADEQLRKGRRKDAVKDAFADRLPPHALKAEAGMLACVLQSPGDILNSLAERRVEPEWFYDLRHREVFQGMMHLHSRREVPVDIITLQEHLKDTGKLEQVGGARFLGELADASPSPANLPYYLDIVRDKFVMRRLIQTCSLMIGRIYEYEGAVDKLLAEAEHEIELLSGALMVRKESHIKQVLVEKVIPQLEEHYTRGKQRMRGLSTGLTYLDKVVRGIRPNYYYVVAARPGDGKTSWAMNLVEHLSSQGVPVGVFTLEMTDDSLAMRLLFSVADVESGDFEQGYASTLDFEKLTRATAKLSSYEIYLDPDPDQTIEMIAAKARRWVKEYGIKLFVLDYIQLLDDDGARSNDRVQTLRKISKKIVSLKNKLNVPWLVLAQMNRNIETADVRRAPVLSDLKECGAIEQDSDVVMFLYPPLKIELGDKIVEDHKAAIEQVMDKEEIKNPMHWPRRVNAAIAKNRYGPTGMAQLLFQKNRCRFLDWHDWVLAKGIAQYGSGERRSANPVEQPDLMKPETTKTET